MNPLIDKNALFREMEKASWYNNADRDEVAEELVLNAPIIEIDPDTVSRSAVIDAIFSEPLYESGMKKRDADVVVPAIYEKIKALPPSPTQSRPQGHWIRHHEITDGNDIIKGYMCNQCKRVVEVHSWETLNEKYPFCHCGADMRQNGGAV